MKKILNDFHKVSIKGALIRKVVPPQERDLIQKAELV